MESLASIDWKMLTILASPLLILLVMGLILVVASPFIKKSSWLTFGVNGLAYAAALFMTWNLWKNNSALTINMMTFDRLSYSFDLIFLLAGGLTLLLSKNYLTQEKIRAGEYHALMAFAIVGSMLIAHSADLLLLFLGLELASLCAYILAGMKGDSIRSYEASMKYFILGSFAAGFLLYGIALAYGASGSTALASFQTLSIPPAEPALILIAIAMMLVGLGFKVAAVPFHLWSPDVYEGSPTSVTAFMASIIKAAGFAALIRILLAFSHFEQIPWTPILWTLAALTMTVGNLAALRQTNIKRMLAYSSIAHAGYTLVGITAAVSGNAEASLGSVIFYLFSYSAMTIGAFAIVIAIGRRGDEADELSDYAGLAQSHPGLAACLAIFLFSLTGIPPMIGFMGKFYLFSGAVEAGLIGLVIVGVLNSVISAYYYLTPIMKMYFIKSKGYELPPISYSLLTAIFLCLFVVVYLGLAPSEIFLMARESVRELFL